MAGGLMMSALRAEPQSVRPRKGEGVTLLLQRHHLSPRLYEAEFRKLNKGKFTADGGLMMGVSYRLPSPTESPEEKKRSPKSKQSAEGYEPLFGKQYARYTVASRELENAVFYLVSGHGGPDPGAIGLYNGHRLHEDEYAYDIVLRLGRELLMRGAKVYFIIEDPKDGIRDEQVLKNSKEETCRGKAIPLDQVRRLDQRCAAINGLAGRERAAYKRAVFIHVDSRGKGKQTDVFFYHSPESRQGKRLAETMRQTFNRQYDRHQPNRGFSGTVSARNLHVLRRTTPVSVFLELGNIQNARDQKRLVLNSNRAALARWIAEGILADYRSDKRAK